MWFSKKFLWTFFVCTFLFASCATGPGVYEEGAAVAVWDLENLSPLDTSGADFGELLSAQVIQTIKEKGDLAVVERERLLLALKELGLGTTTLIDETTRLRLGKLVGAGLMVFGGYQVIGDEMRLDLRLVEVESGRIIGAAQKTASADDLSGWLKAAKEATTELF